MKRMCDEWIPIITLLLATINMIECHLVTISNTIPRQDTNGSILDVHDGNVFLYEGLYYYYGANYGTCKEPPGPSGCTVWHTGECGFQLDHNASLYTSVDLVTWEFRGHVFQMSSMKTSGIMFGPRVLPNPRTGKWVMWFNFLPATGTGVSQSQCAVAVADLPEGPFHIVTEMVTTLAWNNTGDLNLFQDDNGDGYIIYNSHIDGSIYKDNHLMSIEKLSDDYLSSRGKDFNSGIFGESIVEGGAIFKRNGIYYAVFGHCCCYCSDGASTTVYTSLSPLGPFETRNNLGNEGHAQLFNILRFKTNSNDGYGYIWQGNRWQSSPDGTKGHDFTYWSPLFFDDNGDVKYMNYTANFTINIE